MLSFTIKGDSLLDLHLCDRIYNMFGTQSKNYTQYEVDTNQILQLAYHIDQGQHIYVHLFSDDSVKLMKRVIIKAVYKWIQRCFPFKST